MQVALHDGHHGTLKATTGAIDPGNIFKRAGKQMTLQPFNED
jgi:hypothetical protein